jgi:hypothetical protein
MNSCHASGFPASTHRRLNSVEEISLKIHLWAVFLADRTLSTAKEVAKDSRWYVWTVSICA